ncbi:MAG: hypothetical protein ACLFV7_14840 [Phycisphaerae bacterium]
MAMNLRPRNPLPLIVALTTMLLAPALAQAHGLDRPTAAPGATAPLSENTQRGAQLPIPASRQADATLSPAPHQGYAFAYGELVSESLLAPVRGATRTNGQLVQDIGTRADAWAARKGLTGTPQQLGMVKHGYASRLLRRYQSMYGDRGLVVERSFLGGGEVPYGTSGSVRLDVLDLNTRAVWDHKFGAGGLRPAQELKIFTHGPGVTSVKEVRP